MSLKARTTVAALVVAAAVTGAGAVPAGAAPSRVRHVCVRESRVVDTPRGLVVGFLARGTAVHVLARTANGYWTHVRSTEQIVGWIHATDLTC